MNPIEGRDEYWQVILPGLNAAYVFQYCYDGNRLVMLCVFMAVQRVSDMLCGTSNDRFHQSPA
jgi:hypothetical protein